jgi:prophage regulatory protein
MDYTIYRMRDMREGRYPRGRSTIYRDVQLGLLPPPISLGARCSGWLAHEIDAIITARATGATDDEIRAIVARLVAERRRAA